ncbi:uncharacterized protein [Anas platyrhynchos]|uniref:uncharacterized protein isoform X2 n=1 Tax=Anas platyrhynchos TaxID=8839 RepID=UPI003AF2FCE9
MVSLMAPGAPHAHLHAALRSHPVPLQRTGDTGDPRQPDHGPTSTSLPPIKAPAGTSAARRDEEQPHHAHGSLADWPRAEAAAGGSPAPTHQQRDKSLTFRAKQHSLAAGVRGHEGFLLALFVPEHQDLHQQPCEDLLRAPAMKILFLLFPFVLLFLQGAAAGSTLRCRRRGGICRFGNCLFPERHIGRCSSFRPCCSRIFG